MENSEELTNRKEVLKEEIKGLKRDIREMKRELKIKMEEFNEINEELRDLENQDDDENNLISEEMESEINIEDSSTSEEENIQESIDLNNIINRELRDESEVQIKENLEEEIINQDEENFAQDFEENINEVMEESTEEVNILGSEEELVENVEEERNQQSEYSSKRKLYEEDLNNESNKRRKTLEKFIVNISKEIKTEKEIDNESQTKTEILVKLFEEVENIEEFAKGINELKNLKMFNYAESFLLRIEEERERNLSKDVCSIKTKIYQKMIKIGKLEEKDYGRLKRKTQRTIIFYNKIKDFGGRKIIRYFEGIGIDAIVKLEEGDIKNIIEKIYSNEEIDEERIEMMDEEEM